MMKRTFRAICFVSVILACLLVFSACSDPNLTVEEYSMIVTEEDISQLDMFPNLKYVDLRGSTCYEAIEAYIESHPDVQVRYSIQFGNKRIDKNTEELTLNCEKIPFEELSSNLQYLTDLRKVFLANIPYSSEQITQLKNDYPHLELSYSVTIGREQYNHDTQHVDLYQLSSEDLDEVTHKLRTLPNVTTVELMNPAGGTNWKMEDVKVLNNTFSNISFHYRFLLFNKTVSTTDELINYTDISIGSEGLPLLRSALDILSSSTTLVLDDCGIDDSVMAALRDEYPEVKIAWRLHFGKYSILTNEKMIRMHKVITDENSAYLKYCTDIQYMDISNNPKLTDFSFIRSMPKLQAAILSGTKISDLSVFEACSQLEWLDLTRCNKVKDVSALAGLEHLKYLNISQTAVKDIAPVMDLDLKQFVCLGTKVPGEQKNQFSDHRPDCLSRFTGTYPQNKYWRYLDNGETYSPYYETLIPIFHYDDAKFKGNIK